MIRILLSNIGCLDNEGIGMMLKAITENIDAEFYYHKLTVCSGYEFYGVKGSWRCWGYDIALDLGGDTFTLYYGYLQFLRHCFHLFKLWLVGQSYVLFAQTFCEYGFFSGLIAKFFMSRAKLITVREVESYNYLLRFLNNTENVYLAADIAFLLNDVEGKSYHGSSYHKIIEAFLSGNRGVWNGEREDNWKFTVFDDNFILWKLKAWARYNVVLLSRLL